VEDGGAASMADAARWGKGLFWVSVYSRVYVALGEGLILRLAGGDKSTQARDVEMTLDLWQDSMDARA